MATPSLSDTEFVTIVLKGDEGQCNHVYVFSKNRLIQESCYFAAIVNFKEGQDNVIELEEVDKTAFRFVARYLQTYPTESPLSDTHFDEIECSKEAQTEEMILAYVVADRLMMEKLKNYIVDAVQFSGVLFKYINYLKILSERSIPSNSSLVRLLINQLSWNYVYGCLLDENTEFMSMWSPDFLKHIRIDVEDFVSSHSSLSQALVEGIWCEYQVAAHATRFPETTTEGAETTCQVTDLSQIFSSEALSNAVDSLSRDCVFKPSFDVSKAVSTLMERDPGLLMLATGKIRSNFLLVANNEERKTIPYPPMIGCGCIYHDHNDSNQYDSTTTRFVSYEERLSKWLGECGIKEDSKMKLVAAVLHTNLRKR